MQSREQHGFLRFSCRVCGYDAVHRADYAGSDLCPDCMEVSVRVRMLRRVAHRGDRPDGADARRPRARRVMRAA